MNTCETCRFHDGNCCRRFPPQMVADVYTDTSGETTCTVIERFPKTDSEEWCGEHRSKIVWVQQLETNVQTPKKDQTDPKFIFTE